MFIPIIMELGALKLNFFFVFSLPNTIRIVSSVWVVCARLAHKKLRHTTQLYHTLEFTVRSMNRCV